MKTNVVEKGKWERELEVEVDAERIESELTNAYRKHQKKLSVPGFRKGKTPLRIIKARFGEKIRGEVIRELLPTLVEEATREAGLVPAAPPEISKLEYKPGQDLTFTATLEVWPEIEVENYEKLEVTKVVHEVTDEEIEGHLKEIQNRQATERSVERPLEKGDVLIADLQRLDSSGLPIIGEHFEEHRLLIGEEEASSPEFDEALIGISAGEERTVRFAYRDDLPNKKLAGTTDHFNVTAGEVHERTLPELDDEFAKDLGERFQSLDDLRRDIAGQIERYWENVSQQQLRGELLEQLYRRNSFDLPERFVESYLRSLHKEQKEERQPSEEELRSIKRQLRDYLLIAGIRKQAGIEVGDEEFEEFLAGRAEEAGTELEELRSSARVDDLRRELADNKAFELLIESAKIKEEKI